MALTFQKGQGDKIFITKLTRNGSKVIKALTSNGVEYYTGYLTYTLLEDGTLSVKATDVNDLPEHLFIPSIVNGKHVTKIEDRGFENANIKSVVFEGDIIGAYAFYNCKNLRYINKVNYFSFNEIGKYAFKGCALDRIFLSGSIEKIGSGALSQSGRDYVFYEMGAEEWEDVECDDTFSVYFYSEEEPTATGNYFYLANGYEGSGVPTIWGSYCDTNGHSFSKDYVAPTCTEKGFYKYLCPECGDGYIKYESETGHTWQEATCTTPKTCSVCGVTRGKARGHTWSDWEIIKRQNCTEAGEKTRTCSACGKQESEPCGSAIGHDYGEPIINLPTCTEKGRAECACSRCDESYIVEVEAKGHHSTTEGEVVAPTCTEKGYTIYLCDECGEDYKADEKAPLGHTWGAWEFDIGTGRSHRKCAVCGTTEKSKILEFTSIGDGKYSVRAGRTDLSGVIEIPSLDGKVTMIEEDGFKNCAGIKYIVLPNSITTIGNSAFENCYDLERVQIGRESKLTSIGDFAFYNCYSLTQIVLPKSLVYVGLGAFNNKWCAFLYEGNSTDWKTYAPTVLIPVLTDNLYYYIDNSVSAAGSSDTYWKYVDNSPEIVYGASDVRYFTFTELDDGTYSVKATDVSKLPEYVYIPKEYNGKAITKIDEAGFAYNEKVKFYEIPDTIIEIGTRAFAENIRLSKVRFSFGSRLKTIGIAAFEYNEQLATLSSPKASIGEVPSCVTTMLYNAFYYCEKLTKAVIPPKVTTAHEFVFIGCTSVETIELNNVKHINRSAFWECSPISLDIPASVEFIDNTAFGNCSETLESITVDEDNQYYYAEGNCLIRKSDNALLLGCVNSEIPSSVTKILPGAFYGVKGVVITIPSTVTEIGKDAFVASPNTTIRVPMHEAPMKWDINWCDDTVKVIWGYTEGGDSCSHSYGGWLITNPPTCMRFGSRERTCSICGDVEIVPIEPLDHNYEVTKIVGQNCIKDGYILYTCSRCGDTYTEVIPADGVHSYSANVVAPTCTEQGYTEYICDECGDTYKDNYTDALGHSWGDWEVPHPAECEAAGMRERKCIRCGEIETEIIEATGHDWDVEVEVVEPTCTDGGYTIHKCNNCSETKTDSYTDPLGHNIVNGVCTRCGHSEKGIVYYGVSAIPERYNSAFVLGLTNKAPSNSHLNSISVTPLEDEYIYYCAPTSFGDCSFAYNNFVGGFTLIIEGLALTNAGGKTEAYNIYKSNQANLGVNGAITITIKETG